MAKGMKHGAGGSNPLNFKVVGNPQPGNPKENTIWVDTDVKITGWSFCAAEPGDPNEGMVWISTGTSSTAQFNALKKNGIQVYPISAKQYVGGAWVDVVAKSYQGGEWVSWIPSGALYWDGIRTVDWITKSNISMNGWTAKAPTWDSKTVTVYGGGEYTTYCGIVTKNKVDITGYTKLVVEIEGTATAAADQNLQVCISSTQSNSMESSVTARKNITSNYTGTIELPFTASGSYYIDIFAIRAAKVVIKRVYLKE